MLHLNRKKGSRFCLIVCGYFEFCTVSNFSEDLMYVTRQLFCRRRSIIKFELRHSATVLSPIIKPSSSASRCSVLNSSIDYVNQCLIKDKVDKVLAGFDHRIPSPLPIAAFRLDPREFYTTFKVMLKGSPMGEVLSPRYRGALVFDMLHVNHVN